MTLPAKETFGASFLRGLLRYEPENGFFYWINRAGGIAAGSRAGAIDKSGYVRITIGRRQFAAHRLACLYVNGHWPAQQMDHANGDRSDNAWKNLREATCSENAQNIRLKRPNKTGYVGVHEVPSIRKFEARISAKCVIHRLGMFKTAKEAGEAYLAAKKRLHPFQPNTRS